LGVRSHSDALADLSLVEDAALLEACVHIMRASQQDKCKHPARNAAFVATWSPLAWQFLRIAAVDGHDQALSCEAGCGSILAAVACLYKENSGITAKQTVRIPVVYTRAARPLYPVALER